MAIVLAPYGGGTLIGSIGSTTFQRGRYGNLARQRVAPVNPDSLRQQVARNALGFLSSRFSNDLTAAQVAAWNQYAALTNMTPAGGGKATHITGKDHYIRSNSVPLIQGNTTDILDDAPISPGLPPNSIFQFDFVGANTELRIVTANPNMGDDIWILRTSALLNPSRTFWKGPYANVIYMGGAIATPFLTGIFFGPAAVSGQKVFTKWRRFRQTTTPGNTNWKASFDSTLVLSIP